MLEKGLSEDRGEHADNVVVGEEEVVGVTEETERFERLELGAQLADSDDAGDGGGETGGDDEIFEGALGVLDN